MKTLKYLMILWAVLASMNSYATAVDSTFFINGPEGKINVHLQLPEQYDNNLVPMVIICHGLSGNQNEPFISKVATDVLQEGIGVVRFDFNSHGKSDGKFINMDALNIQEDLRRVIEWTERQPFTKNISLAGHSLGGIVVGMVGSQLGKAIKSIVLIASGGQAPDLMLMGNFYGIRFNPWDMPDYIELPGGLHLGKNYLTTMRDLPIYQTASMYKGPVLVLNGLRDTIVPYNFAIRYAEVMSGAELRLIEGENHGFTKTADATALLIARWLKAQQ